MTRLNSYYNDINLTLYKPSLIWLIKLFKKNWKLNLKA